MFAILIGTCQNCGHATHKEVGSIGRNNTDACPKCRLLYTEDGQTNSALIGRVLEWQMIKQYHEAATFAELCEKLNILADGHYQEPTAAWNLDSVPSLESYCRLGGLQASASYGLEHLKFIETKLIQNRVYEQNPSLRPVFVVAHRPDDLGVDSPF